ncbi:MAG: hypothetical protein K6G65_07055 [Lachnospiraceae bacterium]|nr:hypothetical protein [Lachnospiraceae bacterium]
MEWRKRRKKDKRILSLGERLVSTRLVKSNFYDGELAMKLSALEEPQNKERKTQKEVYFAYLAKKIDVVMCLMMAGVVLLLLYSFFGRPEWNLKEGKYLERPQAGEASKEVTVDATWNDNTVETPVEIKAREYTEEEIEVVLSQGEEYLEETILGENEAFSAVSQALHFPKRVPNMPLKISYTSNNQKILDNSGKIHTDEISAGGESVSVHAVISYKGYAKKYEREKDFSFHIVQKEKTEEEKNREELTQAIQEADTRTQKNRMFELPGSIGEYPVVFQEKRQGYGALLMLLLIGALLASAWEMDQQRIKAYEKRNRELMMDYPELVEKMKLFLGAGMTIQGAWNRIVKDYDRKRKDGGQKRYLYEEMSFTQKEIENGVSERIAYQKFGERLHLNTYSRFSTLLVQNLRKGNKYLSEIIGKEAKDAFSERLAQAKRQGETAGTKLLFPMIIMLILVMAMLVLPAMISLR